MQSIKKNKHNYIENGHSILVNGHSILVNGHSFSREFEGENNGYSSVGNRVLFAVQWVFQCQNGYSSVELCSILKAVPFSEWENSVWQLNSGNCSVGIRIACNPM